MRSGGRSSRPRCFRGGGGAHLQWFAAVPVLQAYGCRADRPGLDSQPSRHPRPGLPSRGLAGLCRSGGRDAECLARSAGSRRSPAAGGPRRRSVCRWADTGRSHGPSPTPARIWIASSPGTKPGSAPCMPCARERNRRNVRPLSGAAKTAFEFAANPAAGVTLAKYPDTLLVYRFDESFDRELGPVLIGRRGVTVAEVTAMSESQYGGRHRAGPRGWKHIALRLADDSLSAEAAEESGSDPHRLAAIPRRVAGGSRLEPHRAPGRDSCAAGGRLPAVSATLHRDSRRNGAAVAIDLQRCRLILR